MQAYIAIKHYSDNSNREHIEKISSALEYFGWETICVTRDIELWGKIEYSPRDLMYKALKEIQNSDLIIIDLTEKGVGIGIEAGFAYANNKPIITIAKQGSHVSTTLCGISKRVDYYEDLDNLNVFFGQILIHLKESNT